MLKTAFCKYSRSIKIKISMTCVYKVYEVKQMQLKIEFLLGYNLKIII